MPPSADVHAQHGVLDTLKQAISHVEHAVLPTRTAITANTYSAADAAQAFCNSMQAAFDAKDADGIVKHFRDDGWWRDILVRPLLFSPAGLFQDPSLTAFVDTFQTVDFDFNSIKRDEIKGHLSRYGIPTIQNLKVVKPNDAQFNKEAGWLQAYTSYETPEGRGKGFLRLKESAPGAGDWQAFTFFTALWEIKGHEEHAGHKRPLGAEHGLHESSENWLDRRQKQIKFEDEDPTCLIVGGGQNGLMLAARLTTLGVKTLIVEKNPRIGDSWRRCVQLFRSLFGTPLTPIVSRTGVITPCVCTGFDAIFLPLLMNCRHACRSSRPGLGGSLCVHFPALSAPIAL